MRHMGRYQLDASGHRGSRAVERLVEYAPASGGLALWMQHRDVETAPEGAHWIVQQKRSRWIIGNDGATIFYGPAFVQRALEEQTGLVAHQVLHVALRHSARQHALQKRLGSVDSELFTVCADAIVNSSLSHLQWLTLPKGSLSLDTLLLHVLGIDQPIDLSLQQWDCEALYRAIDDRDANAMNESRQQQNRQSHQQGDSRDEASSRQTASASDSSDSSANHAAYASNSAPPTGQPDLDDRFDGPKAHAARQLAETINRDLIACRDATPESDADESVQWRERLNRSHAADQEQSLMRQLLADNNNSRTPWEQLLRTRLQRALALQPGLNWSRPTRSWIANQGRTSTGHRLPWQPGNTYSKSSPRLCIMVDVSGSVDPTVMQRFSNEIDRILRTLRTSIYLIIGDDQVRAQFKLTAGVQALRQVKFEGGGGTDFQPLINAADKLNPDLGVFLTDLEGQAPARPAWPIIWAVPIQQALLAAPFGERLLLD